MKINYKKLKTNKFNKNIKRVEFFKKKIEKIDKKIDKEIIKLLEKKEEQIKNNKIVFNKKIAEKIVNLETKKELLEIKVNTLEEEIDRIELLENNIDDILI